MNKPSNKTKEASKTIQRKVIKQGPNTLMVSLPIKWVEKNEIKKGDSVGITEESNALIITRGIAAEPAVRKTEIELHDDSDRSHVRTLISNAYKRGYDEVAVKFKKETQIPMVYDAVKSIMGFEITDQTTGVVTIQNIAKELDEEFDKYLRKTFFMIFETAKIMREDYAKDSFLNTAQIEQLDENIKKFTDVCKRSIIKNDLNPSQNKYLFLIVWNLEKLASQYLYAYRWLAKAAGKGTSAKTPKQAKSEPRTRSELHMKPEPDLLKYIDEVNEYFREYYNHFYDAEKINSHYFAAKKNELYFEKAYKLLEETKTPVIVMHFATIARITFNIYSPRMWMEG